jgi:hypothetical protein
MKVEIHILVDGLDFVRNCFVQQFDAFFRHVTDLLLDGVVEMMKFPKLDKN